MISKITEFEESSMTLDEYFDYLCSLRARKFISWFELADIMNDITGNNYHADTYRYRARKKALESIDDIESTEEVTPISTNSLSEETRLAIEKVKISDERIQNNAYIRQISREETLKEIAKQAAEIIRSTKFLNDTRVDFANNIAIAREKAILQLSDWHFGIEINNYWNKYNPDIAISRIDNLKDSVVAEIVSRNIKELYVVNLSDLVAGIIYQQIRFQSRVDVITQTIKVSEILFELLVDLSRYCKVYYYDCSDNHSRLEPNKNNSIRLESLYRITHWYIKDCVKLAHNDNIIINENKYDEDIITFNVFDWKVAAVHGDLDAPSKVVDNLTLMTGQSFDLILTAHLHHFSADEKNECIVVSNGSLMGTDSFAKKLRLTSKPSQNLIIATEDNVVEDIKRILV